MAPARAQLVKNIPKFDLHFFVSKSKILIPMADKKNVVWKRLIPKELILQTKSYFRIQFHLWINSNPKRWGPQGTSRKKRYSIEIKESLSSMILISQFTWLAKMCNNYMYKLVAGKFLCNTLIVFSFYQTWSTNNHHR